MVFKYIFLIVLYFSLLSSSSKINFLEDSSLSTQNASEILLKCDPFNIGKIEGYFCRTNEDCASKKCINNKCIGLTENSFCFFSEQCTLGLYCDKENKTQCSLGKCLKLKKLNEECNTALNNCDSDLYCYNNKCIQLFSLSIGSLVDDYRLCKTGITYYDKKNKSKKCSKILKSKESPFNCSYSYETEEGIINATFNKITSIYDSKLKGCLLPSDDSNYIKALEEYKKDILKEKRHISERFKVNNKTEKKFFKFHDFPKFELYDECIYDFFKSVAASGYIKAGIFMIFGLLGLIL